ncbi:hypothetical protein [Nocardia sp. NPDC046763]|uniref:C1q-like domain-containing protein n=1 Tax=Nocardia sp. NPDC046763 TaxID=3155256 RepID=UPI00340FE249
MPSFTAGNFVKAADLNALRDGINLLTTGMPHAFARQALTTTSVQPNTWTTIVFDTTEVDVDDGWGSSGVYTCATPGWYFVTASVCWANPTNSTSGNRGTRIVVNNTAVTGVSLLPAATSIVTGGSLARMVKLAFGDQLQVQAFQDTGAAITTIVNYAAGRSEVSFCDIAFFAAA